MRGVQFNEYHTAEDWDLILTSKTLTPPTPKTVYVSVDGRNGDLDLSEALTGEIRYENRLASFIFLATEGNYAEREALISTIISKLHGKTLTITLPDYPDYYLTGRGTITERINDKAYGSITIECNCEPWLYSKTEAIRSVTVENNNSSTILLNNQGVKTVTPELEVNGSVTIKFNNSSVALATGTYKLTDLKVRSGNTSVTVQGSGSVTFKYREAIL